MPSSREVLQNFSSVIITGGSSGIGKSFIELLAKLNPELTICNLSRRKPATNVPELKLRHFQCDLSFPLEISRTASLVGAFLSETSAQGRVLLINNSGFGSYGDFADVKLDDQLGIIDVNIRGLVQLTGLLLPLLKSRGGTILNVASTAAFQPTPYMATYGATKAFVLNWSLALNEELRGSGVTTLAVCPGPTPTEFFKRAGLQASSSGSSFSTSADDVTKIAIRALARGKNLVVPGWVNRFSAAMGSMAPKAFVARISAMILRRYFAGRNQPWANFPRKIISPIRAVLAPGPGVYFKVPFGSLTSKSSGRGSPTKMIPC